LVYPGSRKYSFKVFKNARNDLLKRRYLPGQENYPGTGSVFLPGNPVNKKTRHAGSPREKPALFLPESAGYA